MIRIVFPSTSWFAFSFWFWFSLSLSLSLTFSLSLNAQSTIDVKWNGSNATVTIPTGITDVKATVEGANVSLTSTTTSAEYTYRLSGASSDGSFTLYGDYKLTLLFDGLQLTNSHGGAAVDIECGKRIAVELVAGTVNTLADKSGKQKGALYFSGHPEFEGGGTLNVTGRVKHAICAKEYIALKPSTGIINILGAVSDGIHCGKGKANNENNYFLMRGGNVSIMNVEGDGIDSDDYGTINIEGGGISINVPDGATGLKADSTAIVSGGMVNIAVGGTDSEGIRSRYKTVISGGHTDIVVTGNGSKGIKSKCYTEESTVLNGGYVTVSGGQTNIQVLGGNLRDAVSGDTSKCMALSIDADYRQTGGSITITALGPETYTYSVKGTESRTGGSLDVVHTPWSLTPSEYQYDMSVCIAVRRNSMNLTDFTDIAVGAFIGSRCVGYARFPSEVNYGIMRIYGTEADIGSTIKFHLYDYGNGNEYPITTVTTTFAAQASIGTPTSPKTLACSAYQFGDVNKNNELDYQDINLIVQHIIGKGNVTTALADLDNDGSITVADIAKVIDRILYLNCQQSRRTSP